VAHDEPTIVGDCPRCGGRSQIIDTFEPGCQPHHRPISADQARDLRDAFQRLRWGHAHHRCRSEPPGARIAITSLCGCGLTHLECIWVHFGSLDSSKGNA